MKQQLKKAPVVKSSASKASKSFALRVGGVSLNIWVVALAALVAVGLTVFASQKVVDAKERSRERAPDAPHLNVSMHRAGLTRVYVFHDFFPVSLTTRWKKLLREAWERNEWFYTTNNRGSIVEGMVNQKTISRRDIERRREIASRMHDEGQFSYSKWELERNHSIHDEIKAYLEREDVRRVVGRTLGVKGLEPQMGDFFVTLYDKGDFLSSHTDVYGGTFATVAYFSELADNQYKDEYGGQLEFFCEDVRRWCLKLRPGQNELVIFRTRRPSGPPHRVLRVAGNANFKRFGATGWYDELGDDFSEQELVEREKMRKPHIDY